MAKSHGRKFASKKAKLRGRATSVFNAMLAGKAILKFKADNPLTEYPTDQIQTEMDLILQAPNLSAFVLWTNRASGEPKLDYWLNEFKLDQWLGTRINPDETEVFTIVRDNMRVLCTFGLIQDFRNRTKELAHAPVA